jgi:hypothetical protein
MAASDRNGWTYYGGVTTFTNRDRCNRFIKSQKYHTELAIVPVAQFKARRELVTNSSALTANGDSLIRHLLCGGTSVPNPPMGMRRDYIEQMMRAYVQDAQRVLYVYGVLWTTCSETDDPYPIALDPDDIVVSVAIINSHERVFLVESKINYSSAYGNNGSRGTPGKKEKHHEFPFVITTIDSVFLNQTRKFVTSLDSLTQIENFTNTTLGAAVQADARRSNPSAALVRMPQSGVEQKVARDWGYQGSGADAARQRVSENAEVAALQFEMMNERDAVSAVITELRRRTQQAENREAPPQVDEVTGGPKYKTVVIADTRKESIPSGYTVVGLPAATPPPHLIPAWDIRRESAGEVAGVPLALHGGTRTPIAVNQTVQYTFQAALESRRIVLILVCQQVFYEMYKDRMIDYEIKERVEGKARNTRRRTTKGGEDTDDESQQPGSISTFGWTTGHLTNEKKEQMHEDLEALREKYLLHIDFAGFADPLMTDRMYAADMISEESLINFSAAYSGLSKDNFDLARLKEARKKSERMKDLLIEQEELKVKLLEADLKLKRVQADAVVASTAAATAAAAAGPAAGAGAGAGAGKTRPAAAAAAATTTGVGEKRKASSQLEAPSVDTGMMKFGAGKRSGTGQLSAKVHSQSATKQRPHAKRS